MGDEGVYVSEGTIVVKEWSHYVKKVNYLAM